MQMTNNKSKTMISPELLKERIISLYNSGKTDNEIAKKANCDHALINSIRHNRRRIERSSLELVLNLFPDLDKAIADACRGVSGNANIIQGDGNTGVTQTIGCGDLDAYQLRLYQGLASLDIPDDAKAKVLALIKSAAKGE